MTTLYSKGVGGNWSTLGTFNTLANGTGTDTTPTSSDDVIIQSGDTVTLNTTGLTCLTLTVNTGGTVNASTAANWGLTAWGLITVAEDATWSLDISSAPSIAGTVYLSSGLVAGSQYGTGPLLFRLKGDTTKKRWSRTTGAITANVTTSVVIADATSWAVDDRIAFESTDSYTATRHSESCQIASITPGSGTTATITFKSAAGSGANKLAYGHQSGCRVGNMTSNLTITSRDKSSPSTTYSQGVAVGVGQSSQETDCVEIDSVAFSELCNFTYNHCMLNVYGYTIGNARVIKSIKRNAFYNTFAQSVSLSNLFPEIDADIDFNAFYSVNTSYWNYDWYFVAGTSLKNAVKNSLHIAGHATLSAVYFQQAGKIDFENLVINGAYGAFTTAFGAKKSKVINGVFTACADVVLSQQSGYVEFVNADFGVEYGAYNNSIFAPTMGCQIKALDSSFQTSGTIIAVGTTDPLLYQCNDLASVLIQNKNDDSSLQLYYNKGGLIERNTGTAINSDASMRFKPLVVNRPLTYEMFILVAAGESLTFKGKSRRDATTTTITVAADIDNVAVGSTFTHSAAINTWEEFTLTLSHASSLPTVVRVTLSVSNSSVTTSLSYISGIPEYPLVNKVRWYGYLFDETSKTRTANAAITQATEATAYGYTGIAVTGGATVSPITVSVDRTFKELYDYTQAWSCASVANIGYAVPLTASVAGVLTAKANITVNTTKKVSGDGSIAIGSFTLTSEFSGAAPYTYTGGTWSQALTTPSFAGGTLNIGAAGTFEFATTGTVIVSMTPTAPGTYVMGDVTASGTLDLRNTTAHAITVELESGISYTTVSNTGGTITVSVPVITADISVTSMPNDAAGTTRLQIFNSTARDAAAWAANTVYATGAIVKRSTGLGTESTAGLYFRATAGGTSHATTEPTWDTTPGNTTTDGGVTWTCYKVLFYDADPASTSYTDTYIDGEEFKAGEVIGIRFAEMNGSTSFKTYSTEVVATAAGFSALVAEEADSVFATFGIDGSTQDATFSPNFTSDYIVLDSNTDFAGKGAFAYYCYVLTTSQGMYEFWDGVTGIDPGNIRINVGTLNLYFDESAGFVKQTDDVRVFRSDGTRPVIDPTTGGHGVEMNWRTPVSVVTTGGSALTAPESAHLLSLPSAAAVATAVVEKVIP